MRAIWQGFIDKEFRADWEQAKAEHGEATTAEHLARSAAQRRFDALFTIFERAVAAQDGGGIGFVMNLVMDESTFERHLAKRVGADPGPVDPDDERYRCSTIDGHPVDPTDAVAAALIGHVRRVVVGADGVVIDLGRKQRLFTGSTQLAVRLAGTECYWPGCHVPVSACQIDHLIPWANPGGCTCSANGGPACDRHHRKKHDGHSVIKDEHGRFHVHRPDGTEID